ncbi:hypothetical protein [Streptomyces sp. NRRL F-5135]|nr:hypothetical protein [Streptomyces sp. NRRL F-5135]
MALTVSLVVLFFLLRSNSLSAGAAFTAAGFGFFLASTAVIDAIPNL